MRLATWNVNSVKARLPRLLEWLDEAKPDIVCLQEIKTTTALFPEAEVNELGYEVAAHGDGRWNGVALLSSVGLEDVSLGFPGEPSYAGEPETADADRRAGPAQAGGPRGRRQLRRNPGLVDLRAERPHARVRALRLQAGVVRRAAHGARGRARASTPSSRCAATSTWRRPTTTCGTRSVFVGSTHVTPPERQALADLRALGLTDVVPKPMKGPHPFTYWDYRAGIFAKDKGMRIDLVYASQAVADRVSGAYVDREARKGKGPSDHAPIVVDLD